MAPYLSTQGGFPIPADQFENHPPSKAPIVQVKEELAQFCLELSSDLEDFCAKSGITSLQILLAAWAITIRYYTASESVTLGNIVWHCDGSCGNGRYEVGLDDDMPLLRAVEQFKHRSDCDSRDNNSTSPDTSMVDTFVIQNLSTSAPPFHGSPDFNIRGCKIPTLVSVLYCTECTNNIGDFLTYKLTAYHHR